MRRSFILFLALAAASAGCATTGSTFRSGTGDTLLDSPPYYAGRLPAEAPSPSDGVLILPVAYQAGAVKPPSFDPADSPELRALLEQMDRFLADRLRPGTAASHPRAHPAPGVAPDVRFSCETDPMADEDGCADGGHMVLAVGRPSGEWTAWTADRLAENGAHYALVFTLEVGDYRVRQKGWRGDKEVELGTSNVVSLPWLTALDAPVSVLQVTGALVTADGRAVRIGAEGLLARRTGIVASGFGLQELVTDADVATVATLRRDDLPGQPLAWQVALQALVARLLDAPGSP